MTKIEREGYERIVLELKASGFSFDAISKKLKREHKISVSAAAVCRFLQKHKSNKGQAKKQSDTQVFNTELPKSNDSNQLLEDVFLKSVKLLTAKTNAALVGAAPIPRKEADFTEKIASIMAKRAVYMKDTKLTEEVTVRIVREDKEKEKQTPQYYIINGEKIFF